MVGDAEVVIDGLRDVEALHLVALLGSVLVDQVRRLRGVVAADVEEVLDVELLEHRNHGGEILLGRLHAHGAEGRGGDLGDGGEVLGGLLAEVDQVLLQQALDAVAHAEHAGDVVMLERLGDEADQRLVNHNGRTPGLADHRGAGQRQPLGFLFFRGGHLPVLFGATQRDGARETFASTTSRSTGRCILITRIAPINTVIPLG